MEGWKGETNARADERSRREGPLERQTYGTYARVRVRACVRACMCVRARIDHSQLRACVCVILTATLLDESLEDAESRLLRERDGLSPVVHELDDVTARAGD
jgi:hypothetical protein